MVLPPACSDILLSLTSSVWLFITLLSALAWDPFRSRDLSGVAKYLFFSDSNWQELEITQPALLPHSGKGQIKHLTLPNVNCSSVLIYLYISCFIHLLLYEDELNLSERYFFLCGLSHFLMSWWPSWEFLLLFLSHTRFRSFVTPTQLLLSQCLSVWHLHPWQSCRRFSWHKQNGCNTFYVELS